MKIEKQTALFLIFGSILGILGWVVVMPFLGSTDGDTNQEMIAGITEDYDIATILLPMLLIAFTALVLGWRTVASSLGEDSIWINSANLLLIVSIGTYAVAMGLMLGSGSSGSPEVFDETVALALMSGFDAVDLISGVFLFLGLAIIGIVSFQKTSGDRIQQILFAILVIGSVVGTASYLIFGKTEEILELIPYISLLVVSVGTGIKSLLTNK